MHHHFGTNGIVTHGIVRTDGQHKALRTSQHKCMKHYAGMSIAVATCRHGEHFTATDGKLIFQDVLPKKFINLVAIQDWLGIAQPGSMYTDDAARSFRGAVRCLEFQ